MNLQNKHIAIALRGVVDERTKKLARALASAGADVCIHAFTFNRENQDGQPFRVVYHDSVEPKGSELKVRIFRIAHNLIIKKIQEKLRIMREGEFGHKKISQVLVSEKPDLIISINAETLAACAHAAQQLDVKYVYESYEFWPDHAFDEACALNSRQRSFLVNSEQFYANSSACFVTVSDYLAREYQNDLNLHQKLEVVYNCPPNIACEPSLVHSPLRIVFVGNIVPERNIEAIIDAVSNLGGIELFIQGSGNHKKKLEEHIKNIQCNNVYFKERVPYNALSDSLSCYDVGVISYEVYNRHVEGALPNKFFEYMAGGLAMLLTQTKAFEDFENISDFALFIDPSRPKTLVEQLTFLRGNPEVVNRMKERSFEEAQRYCGEALIHRILQVYEHLDVLA